MFPPTRRAIAAAPVISRDGFITYRHDTRAGPGRVRCRARLMALDTAAHFISYAHIHARARFILTASKNADAQHYYLYFARARRPWPCALKMVIFSGADFFSRSPREVASGSLYRFSSQR